MSLTVARAPRPINRANAAAIPSEELEAVGIPPAEVGFEPPPRTIGKSYLYTIWYVVVLLFCLRGCCTTPVIGLTENPPARRKRKHSSTTLDRELSPTSSPMRDSMSDVEPQDDSISNSSANSNEMSEESASDEHSGEQDLFPYGQIFNPATGAFYWANMACRDAFWLRFVRQSGYNV